MSSIMKAVRMKLRFATNKGQVSVEDLFDLPMTKLRGMANSVNRNIKSSDDLFATLSAAETTDKLRLVILLEIIELREADAAAKVSAKERESKRAQLQQLITAKQNEALGYKSIEELQAELDKL